mmetsp:Transcript_7266/g.7976  ORF Transcript_7266/g.7976 Transcript_7266/m.7976 type:complete len:554 (+) Transcript_7266:29-1690(+)
MMQSLLIALVLSVSVAAIVLPIKNTERSFVETSSPRYLDDGWTYSARGDLSQKRSFTMALQRQNTDKFEKLFWEVSNPQSPKYAQYLTIDEITAIIAPKQSTLTAVDAFLSENGIDSYHLTKNKDYITFETTLEHAEELFQVVFHEYRHIDSGKVYSSSLGPYTLPSNIAPVVDFVGGIVGFPLLKKKAIRSPDATFQLGPNDLRQRYKIDTVGGRASSNHQSVAEFQGEYYSVTDLKTYFDKFQTQYKAYDTVTKVVGTNNPSSPGVEAALDIQYIMGVAPKVPTWFWSNPEFNFWDDITAWLKQMDDQTDNPWVHSISYGSQGNYPSAAYRYNTNLGFQKLGLRGISIMFSSGDSGVGCKACQKFQPNFPASSPYVTSVGATRFLQDGVGPEGAVEAFGSGGGFSPLFPIPSYQKSVVDNFLQTSKKLPKASFFNATGRGTPDVSALGIGFQVIVNGQVNSVGGTSASAPTFSALISLLNEERFVAGKKSLGFLNPWLYQTAAAHSDAFNDITIGNNPSGCCGEGFYCQEGWDPVTGLGTPNFQVLKQQLP